ncbi:MAG: hypothetical protein CNIPEHKO_02825 [Anaerolineales bacterium]|nr:hypothetical protein [Anaerolineales bacterium]
MANGLEQAQDFIQNGQIKDAMSALNRLVRSDPKNVEAWIMLSTIAETRDQKRDCLNYVLSIDPNHENALKLLEEIDTEEIPASQNSANDLLSQDNPLDTDTTIDEFIIEEGDVQISPDNQNVARIDGPWNQKKLYHWDQPFSDENQVIRNFEDIINHVLRLIEITDGNFRDQRNSLEYSLKCLKTWTERPEGNSNFFLSPAYTAGLPISLELRKLQLYKETAWLINTFAEMGKILVSRNRDRYAEIQRDYYRNYCSVICRSFQPSKLTNQGTQSELASLSRRLTEIMRFALMTQFRRDKFERSYHTDNEWIESLSNEALAEYFDDQLRYFLDNDRPHTWEFVTLNMPYVYRLRLSSNWNNRIGENNDWENLLAKAGFDDSLRTLRSTGALIIPNRIGEIDVNRLAQIRTAAAQEDFSRVRDLLRVTADEVKSYLAIIAREHLDYREPITPHFPKKQSTLGSSKNRYMANAPFNSFNKAKSLLQKGRADDALPLIKGLWEQDPSNLEMREWTAYAHLKSGNPTAAEPLLKYLQTQASRRPEEKQITDWNMAVILFERKDEAGVYNLLMPWVEKGVVDDALLEVVLALTLILRRDTQFLDFIPRTRHLRFHPLAFVLAYDQRDERRQREILAQLLHQGEDRWSLPPVDKIFKLEELKAVVNHAIVENQLDQLIEWLTARIKLVPSYVPNYLELVRVYELKPDIDSAFKTLSNRLDQERRKKSKSNNPRDINRFDDACRELLDFCKRHGRQDLGIVAYKKAKAAGAKPDILNAYPKFIEEDDPWKTFEEMRRKIESYRKSLPVNQSNIDKISQQMLEHAKKSQDSEMGRTAYRLAYESNANEKILNTFSEFRPNDSVPPIKPPEKIPSPPEVPMDKFVWVNSELQRIRTANAYVQAGRAIEEFIEIIKTVSPDDSAPIVDLIRNFSNAVEAFSHTPSDESDQKRVLHGKVVSYDKRIGELLSSKVLSTNLSNLLRPYYEGTFKSVLGDLSRQAGIGPNIEAEIENTFISPKSQKSTLVLRLTNISERPITSASVQIIVEGSVVRLVDRNERRIGLMPSGHSILLTSPFEIVSSGSMENISEVVFGISLRASAEGYPNIDLGVVRRVLPVKTLEQAIGRSSIPIVFQAGSPLTPSEGQLFRGRDDLLTKIKDSFYGNVQRERYFLDGIRRVGKTSLLNFLPQNLPDNLIPVKVNFEGMGIERQNFSSATFLHRLCELIWQNLPDPDGIPVPPPDETKFKARPGPAFDDFLVSVSRSYSGKTLFLMVDEFQVLLSAVKFSEQQDPLVLDQMRFNIDNRKFYALFTGSTRYDRLSEILNHRIVGSLVRLRISFLSEESVGEVFKGGMQDWVKVPKETIRKVFEMTGGYPRLVHSYGSHLVDLLNLENRTVVTPEDVDVVTQEHILNDNELFSHWWPTDQLGSVEERFVEWLLRNFKDQTAVTTNEFIESLTVRDQQAFRRGLENLRAFEVLDSTRPELIQFRGAAIRKWIELHTDPVTGQFEPPRSFEYIDEQKGETGIFIDHENMIKSLERISINKGVPVPSSDRITWFRVIFQNLIREAERRVGHLDYRIAVAFWNRPHEAVLTPAYAETGFSTSQPIDIEKKNAADFKLVDEVSRAVQLSLQKSTRIRRAIVVTGDGDLAQTVLSLKNSGVQVQVWGGSKETKGKYVGLVGSENVIALDDVTGL